MKKIVFLITSDEYFENYIFSKTLNYLKRKYEIFYYISSDIDKYYFKKLKKVNTFKTIKKNIEINEKIFHLYRYRYLKKSPSFEIRNIRFHGLNLKFDRSIGYFTKFLKIINRFIIFLYYKIYFKIFTKNFFFKKIINHLNSCKIEDTNLIQYFEKIKPDLILIPSQGQEAFADTVIMEAKKRKIKTCYLIDNWDNMSSKTIILNKPSHITVWGRQSYDHARKIHNFKKQQISIIGTPRYVEYFKKRNKKIKSNFNFNYILYIGSFLPSNENKILENIDKFLTNNKNLFNNLKLIYRPHPANLQKYNLKSLKFQNIIIDPQSTAKKKILRYTYNLSLISNAKLLIGGLSSMIIESSIMNKQYICLAHKFSDLSYDPYMVYSKMLHFKGINKLKNVFISKNFKDLTQFLKLFAENKLKNKKNKIKLNYFIKYNKNYSKSLLRVVSKLI